MRGVHDAAADRDDAVILAGMRHPFRDDGLTDALGAGEGLRLGRRCEDQREFLAADPAGETARGAGLVHQGGGDGLQHPVARQVTVQIVVALEPVGIEQQQRHGVRPGFCAARRQSLVELPAVRQSRQGIGAREADEFEARPLRGVLRADPAAQLPMEEDRQDARGGTHRDQDEGEGQGLGPPGLVDRGDARGPR